MPDRKPPRTDPPRRSASGKPGNAVAGEPSEEDRRRALLSMLEDLEEDRRRIEIARREWTQAFDAIGDPVFIHDADYRIVRANRSYAARAGLDIHEIIGRPYWEVFPRIGGPLPNCRGATENAHDGVSEEFTLEGGETFISRAFVIRDEAGRFVYAVHVVEDVTEQRRGETERRLLSEALRQSAVGLILLDHDLSVRYANPAACGLAGYAPGELDGQPLAAVVPRAMHERTPEIRAAVDASGRWSGEVTLAARDGTLIPAFLSAAAITDAGGKRLAYVGSWMDLRPIRQAEEALRASRDLLQSVVEHAPVRVFWKDRASRYLGCNSAFARDAGFSRPEELLGKDDFAMGWREQAEAYRADDRRVMDTDTPKLGFEEPQTTPDGRTIWLRTSKVPLHDRDGRVFGVLGIYEDVTVRVHLEQAEREYQHRIAAQQEAVAGVAMSGALVTGDVEQLAREITETVALVAGVERANVWLFDPGGTELRCIDLYEATPATHSAGAVLVRSQFEHEIDAIIEAKYVDADDPLTDPRTAGYVEGYLKPLRISAMLDVLIHVSGRNLGLLCFEHVDRAHHWERDEVTFARRLADLLALAIVNRELLKSEDHLRRTNRALLTLSAVNAAMVQAADEQSLLDRVCRSVVEVGEYRMAWVGYPAPAGDPRVLPQAAAGIGLEDLRSLPFTREAGGYGDGVTGRALRSGAVTVVQDVMADPAVEPWRAEAQKRGVRSAVALPMQDDGGVFGVLSIYAEDRNSFGEEEVALLTELAGDLAYGIATLRTRIERDHGAERLRESLESTVGAIAATVEMRDPYTAGHERSVAELASAIAREMGLPPGRVEGIHFGALIHDLGKIKVPAEILSKPTRLTVSEFELVKEHAQAGYDILKGIRFPWPVAEMAWQHHERLDGTGYPQGLKGEEITLESRILAVADVVDAMASHRPYRAALGVEAALAEIEEHRGTWYDPAAVDACLRLIREQRFRFPS